MLIACIIIFLPLSAVMVVEIILALVKGCTTLINRRWKFFMESGVKHGEGAFLITGAGTAPATPSPCPPAVSPCPKAAAAAATVAAVV